MELMIDQTDLRILKLLSEDSRISIKDISRSVNLSDPSVKRRIEKMLDLGVIRKFTVDIDYSLLGFTIPFYIKVNDLSIHFVDFVKKIKELDPTLNIYSVTGNENYILKGYARTVPEIEELLAKLMKYGKVSTSIILEEIADEKIIDYL